MSLSKTTVQALHQIILEDYGREITFAEASEIANGLVGYCDILKKIYYEDETLNESNKN